MQDVELSWAEELEEKGIQKGLEKGLEQGLEKGRADGKRETLLNLLKAKFGPLPEAATTRVEAIDSVDELDALLERLLTAASLEDMKL